ncbi:hypothetical protein [Aureispira anguillae]|uniref:Uncharacterized protein n=1 Tax=Aureispira anguillae TaxID=2864201 RepID=A0A915YCI5_9BACT|nr:hypothetical protein AsAng_0012730 [Aureispira anguillae]
MGFNPTYCWKWFSSKIGMAAEKMTMEVSIRLIDGNGLIDMVNSSIKHNMSKSYFNIDKDT